jgi:peptidoglycan hydrolase-like amidase
MGAQPSCAHLWLAERTLKVQPAQTQSRVADGVGMCQWCAERRAEEGMRHEDIVLAAYQRATLVRAY